MVEILFVHGAVVRDGAWWWSSVAELVQSSTGVVSRAVALPSCGEVPGGGVPGGDVTGGPVTGGDGGNGGGSGDGGGSGGSGLAEDARALRDALDDVAARGGRGDGAGDRGEGGGTAIVVGHSYGGTVIAEGAAGHPAVAHLLYITSYLPEIGQSQSDIMSSETDPVSLEMSADGTLGVAGYDAQSFGDRFWADVTDPSIRAGAWQRVTRQSAGAFVTPTTAAAWRDLARPGAESTYLVCADDRSTSIGLQRLHAQRATRAVELPTGHHPFLSRPELVAEQVRHILAAL